MSALQERRDYVTVCFDEWRDCTHARARIISLLRSSPAGAHPWLEARLRLYTWRTLMLWNRFRRAYAMVQLPPAEQLVSG